MIANQKQPDTDPPLQVAWRRSRGPALQADGWRVTPVSRALVVRWHLGQGRAGALVWNRPRWLLISHGERSDRLPVPDATRGLQFMAVGIGLTLAWLLVRLWRGGRN